METVERITVDLTFVFARIVDWGVPDRYEYLESVTQDEWTDPVNGKVYARLGEAKVVKIKSTHDADASKWPDKHILAVRMADATTPFIPKEAQWKL